MSLYATCPVCDEDMKILDWCDGDETCPSCHTKFTREVDEFGGADLVCILIRK